MKNLSSAKVGKERRIAIPKVVQPLLNVQPGDFVLFYEHEGNIVLKKVTIPV